MSGSSRCRLLVMWWLQVGASACELGGARQAYVFDLPLLPHISPYLMQVEEKKHNYRLYKVLVLYDLGRFIGAGCTLLLVVTNPFISERLACQGGLEDARKRSYTKVKLQVDCAPPDYDSLEGSLTTETCWLSHSGRTEAVESFSVLSCRL